MRRSYLKVKAKATTKMGKEKGQIKGKGKALLRAL